MKSKKYRFFFSGGGTLGSVTPLIALSETLMSKGFNKSDFLFVGTHDGVERAFVSARYELDYAWIHSGKLRRYWSLKNFADLFFIVFGFIDSIILIIRHRPSMIVSAGGFCALPLSIVGWVFGVKIYIHQLDVRTGLTNRLLAPFAKRIFVTFSESLVRFDSKKTFHIGTPIRKELFEFAGEKFSHIKLNENLPTICVLGGGLGSTVINEMIYGSLLELLKFCNVIHLTGINKSTTISQPSNKLNLGVYSSYEFIDRGLGELFAMSDVVITRAGLATLSELIALDKKMIIIPIPMTPQQDNADYFNRILGVCVMNQDVASGVFVKKLQELLNDKKIVSYEEILGVDFCESANRLASFIVSDMG